MGGTLPWQGSDLLIDIPSLRRPPPTSGPSTSRLPSLFQSHAFFFLSHRVPQLCRCLSCAVSAACIAVPCTPVVPKP